MKKRYVILLTLGAVVALGGALNSLFGPTPENGHLPAANTAPIAATKPQKPTVSGKIELRNLRWRQSGFGSVAIFNFTAINHTEGKIKDLKLYCEYYSKSGTKLGSGTGTIYEALEMGKSTAVKDFNMGFINNQTDDARCRIDDYVKI